MEKDFWEFDERKVIWRFFLKCIFGSGNEKVLLNMRDIECIFIKLNGCFWKFMELVNEYFYLLYDMFFVLDERFLEDELFDVKKILIDFGMNDVSILDEMFIKRVGIIKK